MAVQGIRIGVDVGGTFTDLIAHEPSTGEVFVGKQLTSPARPDEGVLEAVAASLSADALNTAQTFVHGTTVGLNALLERRGATVGLLVTRGFRDVLELRRGDRDDPYDLFWRAPEPLVPRHLRLPVAERVRADGTVHAPLSADDVAAAARTFAANGVDAVAIAFMNAYANPAHEQEAERLLREAGFAGDISVSHRVSGEYREYERTCTTVIDAFVRRRMGGYLDRLAEGLQDRGFAGGAFITRSGGGALSFPEATDRPFETIMSGPVAGVAAAQQLTELLGLGDAIAADVGGTSFDTCLIADGRAPVLYEGSIIGLPLQTPWVDVRSIGAGGGSIASVDAGGLLRVGPRSAGARPGPACYGAGGTEPTVTDAAVLLGMLPPGPIAGDVVLDPDLARAALEPLAGPLGFADADEVARGVIRVACAHMADAIRSITVESGRDPRDAAMIGFGGAGPVLATVMAHELDITTIVVPPHAGNLSAWGLLGVDLAQTSSRTRLTRLSDEGLQEAQALIAELTEELDRRSDGTPDPRRTLEVHADMRYVGQEHTLTIVLDGDAETVRRTFSAEYQRAFGAVLDEELEIVTFRVIATTPLSDTLGAHLSAAAATAEDDAPTIEAHSFTRGERTAFPIRARAALAPGDTVAGPAILTEPTTTTYLDAGHTATVHATGALVITKEA
ncbi:MAG TPA: hydantoinase/oxoprolinase family protein [Baekduia sp.]|uniref:hydantoinase/oxoprolinase family protein n=1 Tax=Baekduia sp. TaxID=2600305 RepID=UPI002D772DD0|nr:hydantoinase/oxoprolinase family protein [Baekduia sp.]HET6505283.1 hydantoinase/oxoprolinase family protein [Baekduia sp.]